MSLSRPRAATVSSSATELEMQWMLLDSNVMREKKRLPPWRRPLTASARARVGSPRSRASPRHPLVMLLFNHYKPECARLKSLLPVLGPVLVDDSSFSSWPSHVAAAGRACSPALRSTHSPFVRFLGLHETRQELGAYSCCNVRGIQPAPTFGMEKRGADDIPFLEGLSVCDTGWSWAGWWKAQASRLCGEDGHSRVLVSCLCPLWVDDA